MTCLCCAAPLPPSFAGLCRSCAGRCRAGQACRQGGAELTGRLRRIETHTLPTCTAAACTCGARAAVR